jgi:hypothetical protein
MYIISAASYESGVVSFSVAAFFFYFLIIFLSIAAVGAIPLRTHREFSARDERVQCL